MDSLDNYATCDESKCVSRGRTELHNDSFTCYGDDGEYYPRMCADGYLPVVVEDEPPSLASHRVIQRSHKFESILYNNRTISVRYFTCCPPKNIFSLKTMNISRQCSDPIVVEWDKKGGKFFDKKVTVASKDTKVIASSKDNNVAIASKDKKSVVTPQKNETISPQDKKTSVPLLDEKAAVAAQDAKIGSAENICEFHGTRKHPIQMKLSRSGASSFLCCDSESTNAAQNYLDDVECVPYVDKSYLHGMVEPNTIGELYRFQKFYCEFKGPGGDFIFPRPIGNGTIDDAITTRSYQCCKTGPPIPLYIQDATFWATTSIPLALFCLAALASFTVLLGLLTPLIIQLKTRTYRSSSSERGRRGRKASYSTYNLYLVYLAVPDIIYSLSKIVEYGMLMNQKELSISSLRVYGLPAFYSVSNLWLNAIVLYQMMLLLRSSDNAQRINQPSLRRVSSQALVVYFLATMVGVLTSYTSKKWKVNSTPKVLRFTIHMPSLILPIAYGIYSGLLVWWRGYLKATVGTTNTARQAKRTLAIFFFRIVVIFIVIWVPAIVSKQVLGTLWGDWLFLVLTSLQPTLTACAILSKEDCRKYIFDLFTLPCTWFDNKEKALNDSKENQNNESSSTMVLSTEMVSSRDNPSNIEGTGENDEVDEETQRLCHSSKQAHTRKAAAVLATGEIVSRSALP